MVRHFADSYIVPFLPASCIKFMLGFVVFPVTPERLAKL